MNKIFVKTIINIILSIILILPTPVVSMAETTNNPTNPTSDNTITADSQIDASENTKKILFVGNSMTSAKESITGDLKNIISDTNENAEIDTMICFGKGFKEYADKKSKQGRRLRNMLKNKKYDVIVFQEQPSALVTAFDTETYPCFKTLKELAVKNGARPIIYMTWRFNYTFKRKIKGVVYKYTPKQMIDIMTKNSLKLGLNYGTKVVTAGLYLEHSNNIKPQISMWRPNENKHQSYSSAYLVACVFYRELFDKSPTSINYFGKVPEPNATYLQQIADLNMSLNTNRVKIKRGDKFKLKASITSLSQNNKYLSKKLTFIYKSSNPKVATVNAKTGNVKGIKKGRAIIYVTSKQTGLAKACVVTVK